MAAVVLKFDTIICKNHASHQIYDPKSLSNVETRYYPDSGRKVMARYLWNYSCHDVSWVIFRINSDLCKVHQTHQSPSMRLSHLPSIPADTRSHYIIFFIQTILYHCFSRIVVWSIQRGLTMARRNQQEQVDSMVCGIYCTNDVFSQLISISCDYTC